ncbi:MAG TPA: DUF5050 domain-containing protein [Spirochaetota bacterium]|nr:DUF5050 domain-containing protein [Spirochaetota bacterium]
MIRIISALSLLLSTSLFSYRITSEKIDSTLRTLHFNVHYEKGYEANAARTAEYAELAYEQLSEKFRIRIDYVTDIILYQDYCDYLNTRIIDINYDDSILAFSSPENKYIVLPFYSERKTLKKIIFHEMTHFFIHKYIKQRSFYKKIPSELEEAFCEYFSGVDSRETMILRDMILSKNQINNSFKKYHASYFPDSSIISAFALYLVAERHGEDAVIKIISDVLSGDNYRDLIEKLTGGDGELSGFLEKKAVHDDSEMDFTYSEIIPQNKSISDYCISEEGMIGINYGRSIVLYKNGKKVYSKGLSISGRTLVLNDISMSSGRIVYSVLKNGKRYAVVFDLNDGEKYMEIPVKNSDLVKISKCGNYLYYVIRSSSSNIITEFSVNSNATKILYSTGNHIYDYILSEKNIFVSEDTNGSGAIKKINYSAKTDKTIAHIKAFDLSISGRYLYFSSDNDGTFQIYSIDTENFSILRHTNSSTSAKMPFVSGEKLYFSVFRNMNWHISEKLIQGTSYNPLVPPVVQSKSYYDFRDSDFSDFENRIIPIFDLNVSVFNYRYSGMFTAAISGITNQNSFNIKAGYKYRKNKEKDTSAGMFFNSDNGILNYQAGFYHLKNPEFNDGLSVNVPFSLAFEKQDTLYARAFLPLTGYISIGSAFYFQHSDDEYYKTATASIQYDTCDNVIASEKSGISFKSDFLYTFSKSTFMSYDLLLDIYADISPFSLYYRGSFYKSRLKYKSSYMEFLTKEDLEISSEIMQKNKFSITFDFNEINSWRNYFDVPLSVGVFWSRYHFGNSDKINCFNETGFTVFVENSNGLFLYLDCGKTYRYREGLSGGGVSFGASFSI